MPPFFADPGSTFYGVLELNLTTNIKRWITPTSTPVAVPPVINTGDVPYWGGHKIYLDKQTNIFYYAMGSGLWWWNRTTNATGLYSTSGGIPVASGNPQLPSNLTTHIFIDHTENKFYIGTHAGLFVWDMTDNTSEVFNIQNSLMITDIVNTISKNSRDHLIYVACEEGGGLFQLNSLTGEQKILTKDYGNDSYPQMIDTEIESAYFDENEHKLYVCSDNANGGLWIKDYNNLLPDYGELSLQTLSPALDLGDDSVLPSSITVDINGLTRHADYASISGSNSLDLGAYERPNACQSPTMDFAYEKVEGFYAFTPSVSKADNAGLSYTWTFGDGTVSHESSSSHAYAIDGTYTVALNVTITPNDCPQVQLSQTHPIVIDNRKVCEGVYCDGNGRVAIGAQVFATGYALGIKGKAISQGAQVMSHLKWPDYVFTKGYQLMPLPELKSYVLKYRHLPEIPTDAEVKNNGLDVELMSNLLLKKTEELTLYLIELDERLRKLEEKKRN